MLLSYFPINDEILLIFCLFSNKNVTKFVKKIGMLFFVSKSTGVLYVSLYSSTIGKSSLYLFTLFLNLPVNLEYLPEGC